MIHPAGGRRIDRLSGRPTAGGPGGPSGGGASAAAPCWAAAGLAPHWDADVDKRDVRPGVALLDLDAQTYGAQGNVHRVIVGALNSPNEFGVVCVPCTADRGLDLCRRDRRETCGVVLTRVWNLELESGEPMGVPPVGRAVLPVTEI